MPKSSRMITTSPVHYGADTLQYIQSSQTIGVQSCLQVFCKTVYSYSYQKDKSPSNSRPFLFTQLPFRFLVQVYCVVFIMVHQDYSSGKEFFEFNLRYESDPFMI